MSSAEPLAGKKLFVLEDEMVIAMELEFALRDAGAREIELCFRLTETSRDEAAAADAAVIDLDIRGESSIAIAHHLLAKGIPFIIATGLREQDIDPSLATVPKVRKPYLVTHVVDQLHRALQETGAAAPLANRNADS